MKRCTICKNIKSASEFRVRNTIKGWLNSECKSCSKARFKKYYREHHIEMKARAIAYHNKWKEKRFQEVLNALGRVCACCGEARQGFLTVDHINNDGYKERVNNSNARAGRALWSKVRREGYPKDRYRILCYNCNCGRARMKDKICPHEKEREMSKPIQTPATDLGKLQKQSSGQSSMDGCFYADGDTSGFDLVIGVSGAPNSVLLEDLSK